MSDIITVRDIETVTTEIKTIRWQAQQVMLLSAIEIGRRLAEAKEMLPHGEWGKWLAESVDYSQSTADNLLRIYKEYGSQQESLFDNFSNSEALTKLSYTQALALLAVPAEEREEFVRENHVEEMSTRELQQAIRERDQARTQLEETQGNLRETELLAEENLALAKSAKEEAAAAKRTHEELKEKLRNASTAQQTAEDKVRKLRDDLRKAKDAEAEAKTALQEAKEHPEMPESIMEQMRAEVAAQAADEATADLRKQLAQAQNAVEAAEHARQETQVALEAAEKKVKMSAPEVAVFGSMFEDLQESINKINAYRLKTEQTNPDAAGGMLRACQALFQKSLNDLS